ncbi:phage tail terminator protein (plasmid) [Acinetobacter baumannii]
MPISVTNGILLRNPINGTKIDHELKGHYNTEFKVIVRTTNYETGYKLMKKVFKLLTLDNHFVEGMHIKQCYPDNEPPNRIPDLRREHFRTGIRLQDCL